MTFLFRRKDLGALGHEIDPAENDDLGVGAGGLLRQAQGIAHVIGDILHLR